MITGRYFLVFWQDEGHYSDVAESKIVGNPGSVGETFRVKERQKVHTGVVVAVGNKQDIYSSSWRTSLMNNPLRTKSHNQGHQATIRNQKQTREKVSEA